MRTEGTRRLSLQGGNIFHVFKLAISFVSSSFWTHLQISSDLADARGRELYNITVNIGSGEMRTEWRRQCSLQGDHIFQVFKLAVSFKSSSYQTFLQNSSDFTDTQGRELYMTVNIGSGEMRTAWRRWFSPQGGHIFCILQQLNKLAELFWFGWCRRERIIQYNSYIQSGEVRTEWRRRCSLQNGHIFHVFKLAVSFISSGY